MEEIKTLDKIKTFRVPKDKLLEEVNSLKEKGFDFLMDLCGVDFPSDE